MIGRLSSRDRSCRNSCSTFWISHRAAPEVRGSWPKARRLELSRTIGPCLGELFEIVLFGAERQTSATTTIHIT